MRINSIPPKDLLSRYVHVRERVSNDVPVSSADQTELTSEAKTFSAALKAAREELETADVERQERIARITQQIADGTYEVSGLSVAQKMLGRK